MCAGLAEVVLRVHGLKPAGIGSDARTVRDQLHYKGGASAPGFANAMRMAMARVREVYLRSKPAP